MQLTISKKLLIGASLGTMLEYYDFALFALFLPIISPVFFPSHSAYGSLETGYYALMITLIARPLGGLIFGYIGDTYGRRGALLGSMYGIAIATFIIGITPSYSTIGIAAIVIVIMAKAAQVFCYGGEYNGAGIYVVENAKPGQEAFVGSILTAIAVSGSLIASLLGIISTWPGMPDWSWRVLFMLGGLVGLFGIFYRKNLTESPNFKVGKKKNATLKELFKHYPKELVLGAFIGGFTVLPYTTVVIFINPVLTTKHDLTNVQLMMLQGLLMLISMVVLVVCGRLADKFTPGKVMKWAALALTIGAYPLILLVDAKGLATTIVAEIILIIINQSLLAPSNAYFKNLFAMEYRYRASSVSFCFGMSLIGGITPVIENYLYKTTHHFSSISIWLIVISAITFILLRQRQQAQI